MSCIALIVCIGTAQAAQAAQAPASSRPLAVRGPIPSTAQSHAFSATTHQSVPFDLASQGYVEEEFFVSGSARVFELNAGVHPAVQGEATYITRILVRRPAQASRFDGTVIVEPMNPSVDVDLPIMWAQSYRHFIAAGHAWVGITIKPNTIRALKLFDPARYGELTMPNPRSNPCAPEGINPVSRPTTPADETGLAWDMLSQIGAWLKSERGAALLGGRVARTYMTGQSQSAGYARTYATFFARDAGGPRGAPLYDGFLYSGSPPWQVPLNQCAAAFPDGDPRLLTGPAGVPVIELFAQGDIGTNIASRRPDSDRAPDLFRRYEIAGAAHVDPWEMRSFASDADADKAQGRIHDDAASACEPRGVTESDFPNRYLFDAAWAHLDGWVRKSRLPPRAPPLQLRSGAQTLSPAQMFEQDEAGNARGGVRSPWVDVPTTRWVGAKTGAFSCMFEGYQFPFSRDELARRYGSPRGYLQRLRENVASHERQRWLTPADAAEILREVEARGDSWR